MSKAEINRQKVLGELFTLTVFFNDARAKGDWNRLSPTTREAYVIFEEMLKHIQEAIRSGRGVVFELVVYQQTMLGGSLFEVVEDFTPQEPEQAIRFDDFDPLRDITK